MDSGEREPYSTAPPFASVVIPAYNCAATLERCLASVFAQTYPRDRYEIAVVDDGSTDATAATAQALGQAWPGRFVVIRKANGGPASARNAGVAATSGEIVAFLDADCVAQEYWLQSLVGTLASGDAAGVGGPLINVAASGWVPGYLHAANFYRHRVRNGTVEYLVTANVAFRRSALEAVGGFSRREAVWGEDADLSFRLTQSGGTLLLAPQGAVLHYGSPTSVRGFARELYRYGYGSGALAREWPAHRRPLFQLVRHLGALGLSPVLALTFTRRVGFVRALSYWPVIAIEHASFCVGLIHATMWWGRGRDVQHEHSVRECHSGRA
jgi:GT2 family glycosyltransferase